MKSLGSGNKLFKGPELGGEVRLIQHDWVKENEVSGRKRHGWCSEQEPDKMVDNFFFLYCILKAIHSR